MLYFIFHISSSQTKDPPPQTILLCMTESSLSVSLSYLFVSRYLKIHLNKHLFQCSVFLRDWQWLAMASQATCTKRVYISVLHSKLFAARWERLDLIAGSAWGYLLRPIFLNFQSYSLPVQTMLYIRECGIYIYLYGNALRFFLF